MDELCINCFPEIKYSGDELYLWLDFFKRVRKVAVLLYALGSQISIHTCPMLMQSYAFVKINSKKWPSCSAFKSTCLRADIRKLITYDFFFQWYFRISHEYIP